MCLGAMIVLGMIFAVIFFLAASSAVSSAGADVKAKQEYQVAQVQWELDGRKGPEPQMPRPVPPRPHGSEECHLQPRIHAAA